MTFLNEELVKEYKEAGKKISVRKKILKTRISPLTAKEATIIGCFSMTSVSPFFSVLLSYF
jgi:hypothetical protein